MVTVWGGQQGIDSFVKVLCWIAGHGYGMRRGCRLFLIRRGISELLQFYKRSIWGRFFTFTITTPAGLGVRQGKYQENMLYSRKSS